MLYRVKLSSIVVDARNRSEAYASALAKLRTNPEALIAGVYNDEIDSNRRSLFNRLLTGK